MQQVKRRKSKKAANLDHNYSGKSIKSDLLHGSSRPSTAKSAGRVSSRKCSDRDPLVGLSHAPPSEVPKNVAVHFASFYQNENPSLPHSFTSNEKRFGVRNTSIGNYPKMEFTRQMVYKLENSAGTYNYGREVSSVLDKTVESPGFDLKLPPIDDCSPVKKSEHYYPLWYKDPNKMPQISRDHFRELKGRYKSESVKKVGEEVRKAEESIGSDTSESDVEFETETETDGGKGDEEREEDGSGRDCGSESIASSAVDDSKKVEKRCSWSSHNSCETETSQDDEDEDEYSLNWETEVDDDENHGVVALGTRNEISQRIQRSIVSSFL